mgnify:CR=1 FL=1|tara:strand:+ start:9185 stop:9376 length:192 start_codon:yes stop_codon:yes gene_type:complete
MKYEVGDLVRWDSWNSVNGDPLYGIVTDVYQVYFCIMWFHTMEIDHGYEIYPTNGAVHVEKIQ